MDLVAKPLWKWLLSELHSSSKQLPWFLVNFVVNCYAHMLTLYLKFVIHLGASTTLYLL